MNQQYDIIFIGSGIGAATVAKELAETGKSILIIERGDFIPKEKENWDPIEVVEKGRYCPKEKWLDKEGNSFEPFTYYTVGGNSKVYGAAAFRLREKDFTAYATPAGISPAWPLSYTDFKPYYDKAEKYMSVHGVRGEDPIEPFTEILHTYQLKLAADKIYIHLNALPEGIFVEPVIILPIPEPEEKPASFL